MLSTVPVDLLFGVVGTAATVGADAGVPEPKKSVAGLLERG